MNKLSKFLSELRKTNPEVISHFYLHGSCLQLYRIVKTVIPEVECWHEPILDYKGDVYGTFHIWIKYQGKFYDILGQLTSKRKNTIHKGYGCNLRPFPYDPNKHYSWGNSNRSERLKGITIIGEDE